MSKYEFENLVHVATKLQPFYPDILDDVMEFMNLKNDELKEVEYDLAISNLKAIVCKKIDEIAYA